VKFVRKYFEYPDGRKEWCVTGDFGSLSFWATEVSEQSKSIFGADYYGGVETHYNEKSKPNYLGENSSHDDCICNAGKCWHDGTSLWASEYWIPYVLPRGADAIWKALEFNYSLKAHEETEEIAVVEENGQ